MEIIAEVGANFETIYDCKAAIVEAAKAGATAVKFQYFSQCDLYGCGTNYTKLDPDWLPILLDVAKDNGLLFGVTAFSQEGVDLVSPFVDFYKVASAENGIVFNFKRDIPILISTGGATLSEIDEIVQKNKLGSKDCLLYCVPAYPAKIEDYSMRNILTLFRRYPDIQIGISDHTDGVELARILSVLDLTWIEKHFRPKNTQKNSPDYGHAVAAEQFSKMVEIYNSDCDIFDLSEADLQFRESVRRRPLLIDGRMQLVRPRL